MPIKRKPRKDSVAGRKRNEHDDTESVAAFLDGLQHPLKPILEAIRLTILSADKSITEGIKWNTASFYCCGWFATINVRASTGIQVVLHQGAKIRDDNSLRQTIDDPSHTLTWLAQDRATIAFASAADFKAKQATFKKIIQQWARHQTGIAKAA